MSILRNYVIFVLFVFFSRVSFSGEKVIYKYKKYESFNLGKMQIKGDILTPGDLSVGSRGRKIFSRKLFDRKRYDDFSEKELRNLR